MTRVLYVPLDDRDCNYEFPYKLSRMTDDIELLRPPFEWVGYLKEPGKVDRIWKWLFENAGSADYAILSVDMLVYGNIIGSRINQLGIEEALERTDRFVKLKSMNPNLHIHAFNLVARVAAYNDSHEDPDYWEDYGEAIWRYTYLEDKQAQEACDEGELAELQQLIPKIPRAFLDDFLHRRSTDRAVNLECVDLVKKGVFDILTVPKDDTAEYGYAAMDQAAISRKVSELSLQNKVYVYPGADEVGCVLLARVFNLIKQYTPVIYVRYASVNGAGVIPRYEDRPLGESIKWQVTSAGGKVTEVPENSSCLLAVNVSGTGQMECDDQDQRTVGFKNNTNSEELLRYVEYYCRTYERPIGISDDMFSNGCDNEFMENARCHGVFDKITALGGWNTAENTNGVVISQIIIAAYYHNYENMPAEKHESDTFLLRSICSDWFCQANILRTYVKLSVERGVNPYFLKENVEFARQFFSDGIREMLRSKLDNSLKGECTQLINVRFNWDGAFYFAIDVSLGADGGNML
ncbi:MAG: DUF4127 family protein [Lachnospiraceae bacterium]